MTEDEFEAEQSAEVQYTLDQHLAHVRQVIYEDGFYVQHVASRQEHHADGSTYVTLPYAFTVGRSLLTRPELLVSGTWSPTALEDMLRKAVAIDEETPIVDMQVVENVIVSDSPAKPYPPQPVLTHRIDPWRAEMYIAIAVFKQEISALQLLWPDPKGLFPGQPGYNPGDHLQAVFQ